MLCIHILSNYPGCASSNTKEPVRIRQKGHQSLSKKTTNCRYKTNCKRGMSIVSVCLVELIKQKTYIYVCVKPQRSKNGTANENPFVYKSSAKKEPLTSWWFFPNPSEKKMCGSQIGSWNPKFRGEQIKKNIWVAKPPSGKDCANFGSPDVHLKLTSPKRLSAMRSSPTRSGAHNCKATLVRWKVWFLKATCFLGRV